MMRRPASPPLLFVGMAVFLIVGIICLIAGFHGYEQVQPISGGQTTTGSVASVTTGQHCGRSGCSTYWTPTISFHANGQSYEFIGPEYDSAIWTGAVVKVSYDPQNPINAHDISAPVGNAMLEMALGAGLIILALLYTLAGFRRIHGVFGLPSARGGSGWVGQQHLHSVAGMAIALALCALVFLLAVVIL